MAATVKVNFVGDAKHLNTTISNTERLITGFKTAAKLGGLAVAGGVVAGISASVSSWTEFNDEMTRSLSIFDDVSPDQILRLNEAARALGPATRFSATEGAEALYFLKSAGLDAEEVIAYLPVVAEFAQAGMLDLSTATRVLTNSQAALGLKSEDTAENLENLVFVGDALVYTAKEADASILRQ